MLKTLLLRNKIDVSNKKLEALRAKNADFDKRTAELAAAIKELDENTSEEDRKVIEDKSNAVDSERDANDKDVADLEADIKRLNEELEAAEKTAEEAVKAATEPEEPKAPEGGERKVDFTHMENRDVFKNLTREERKALFERDDTKKFITDLRSIAKRTSVSGTEVTIPEVMLPIIKPIIEANSKLKKYLNVSAIRGTGRQATMGTIPTAIWVEATAAVSELALAFNAVTTNGYKVCGYFALDNSDIEDSDENLIADAMTALGEAIAKAEDKAAVYGTGSGMPLGFVTRLAQAAKPADYPATERAWKELDKTNILTITGKTGADLFAEIARSVKPCINDYAQNNLFFVMSEATRLELVAQSAGKNSNATIVAGIAGNQMPLVGGSIETCNWMKDGDIAFGYGEGYKWVDRKTLTVSQSTDVKFLDDQTVIKGVARADGRPVIAEAFGILNIAGVAPTTTITF